MAARRDFFRFLLSTCATLSFPVAVRAHTDTSDLLSPLLPKGGLTIEDIGNDADVVKIIVVGVGGGGCNAVEHMIGRSVKGVEFMCVNTDAQNLKTVRTQKIVQLGSSGLGTGGKPDLASLAASEAENALRSAMSGAHMVFITAGLGGGTGTGAAPVIARIAKNMGILTVAVVTQPFKFEDPCSVNIAKAGVAALEPHVDAMIVIPNENLLRSVGDDTTMEGSFTQTNDSIKEIVSGFAGVINVACHVNIDFRDVRDLLTIPGHAALGTATATGMNRERIAAEKALIFLAMDGGDLSKAKGVLVMISAAKGGLTQSGVRLAKNTILAHTSPSADFYYGTFYDEHLDEGLRVTVMANGL